jgi:hypothetical protein
MFISLKKHHFFILSILCSSAYSVISCMQHQVETPESYRQIRQRLVSLTPNLHSIDLFLSRISQMDKQDLQNPQISDEEFKQKAQKIYLQTMPLQYRAWMYTQQFASYATQQAQHARSGFWSLIARFWTKKSESATQPLPPQPITSMRIPLKGPGVVIPSRQYPQPESSLTTQDVITKLPQQHPRTFLADIKSRTIPALAHSEYIKVTGTDHVEVRIPRALLHLLPTLKTMSDDLGDVQNALIPVHFEGVILNKMVNLAWQTFELLQVMTNYTRHKYGLQKIYTVTDIPLTIRYITLQMFEISLSHANRAIKDVAYTRVIEAANYMDAAWLIDPLAANWMLNLSLEQRAKILQDLTVSQDLRTNYLQKWTNYLGENVCYEFSVADFCFLVEKDKIKERYLEDANNSIRFFLMDDIQFLLERGQLGYMDKVYTLGILRSLTGFEFLSMPEFETRTHLLIYALSYRVETIHAFAKRKVNGLLTQGINALKPYTFLGLPNLTTIHIFNIGLNNVESKAFANLPNLQEIDFSDTTRKMPRVYKGTDPLYTHLYTLKAYKSLTNKITTENCEQIKKELGGKVKVRCGKD